MKFDIENILRPIAYDASAGLRATGLSVCALGAGGHAAFGTGHITDGGAPVDAATLFGIGSLTKAQTALACLAAGLDLERAVAPMLPGWDGVGATRLGDLLSGRTGRRHMQEIPLRAVFDDTNAYLRAALRLPPDAAAGQRFRYSNAMFTLAARLLAQQTGRAGWHDALAVEVWGPLGMADTRPFTGEKPGAPAAMPHLATSGRMRAAGWGFFGREMEEGAGAVMSSARDMLRLLRLFACPAPDTPSVLVRAARQALQPRIDATDENPLAVFAAATTTGAAPTAAAYGFGWFVHNWRGQRLATHSGGFGGFSAYVALQPDSGRGVAMLANARAPRAILEGACLLALDRLAGIDGPDWLALARALPARPDFFAIPDDAKDTRAPTFATLPRQGLYATDVLGPIIRVTHSAGRARLNCGRLQGNLRLAGANACLLTAPGVLERPLQDILVFPGLDGHPATGGRTRFAMWQGLRAI